MWIKKLENGTLQVPKRVEDDGIVGDTVIEITPDHVDYKKHLEQYEREQALRKELQESNKSVLR